MSGGITSSEFSTIPITRDKPALRQNFILEVAEALVLENQVDTDPCFKAATAK
jgi:hypothetical protein